MGVAYWYRVHKSRHTITKYQIHKVSPKVIQFIVEKKTPNNGVAKHITRENKSSEYIFWSPTFEEAKHYLVTLVNNKLNLAIEQMELMEKEFREVTKIEKF